MKKIRKVLSKVRSKAKRRQWGRRPNRFYCGLCKALFKVRRKLDEHKDGCM